MQIQICDAQWKPTSELIDATARGANPIRPNETPRFTFGVQRDHPAADSLQLSTNVLAFGSIPARIIKRDEPGHEIHIEALGCEDMLNNMFTPHRWVRYNDVDLSAVVTDLMSRFRMVRWTTLADWQGAYDVSNVEIINLADIGDSVILATEPYYDADRYLASGYITLRCQLPASAMGTGRVIRWTEHVGAENRIKVQTRTANSEAELNAAAWGVEIELTHAEEIEDNETAGADVENGGRWIDVRLNLYTEDRETVDSESETTIVGTTPILAGVELIYREAGPISIGNAPITGVKVTDTEYNRMSHLKVLQELCSTYEYTYRLRLENGKLALDLAKTFGADRSSEVVLAHNDNCIVDVFTTGDDELANILHCWGAGDGAEQLYVELRDRASIDALKAVDGDGERHADFEDNDITDLATLTEKGQAELDRRKEPRRDYQVRTSLELLGDAWIQDTVSVVDPQEGTSRTAEIKELNITDSPQDGEVVRIGLGAKITTLVDEIATHLPKETGKKTQPTLAAPMLRAKGKYEAVILTWNMVASASGYDLECSEDGGTTWKLLASGLAALRYNHELPFGAERKYQVFAKRGGVRSAASNVTIGKARDNVAPTISAGISVSLAIRGLTVGLIPQNDANNADYATDWSRVPDWDGAEVYVGTTADFVPGEETLKDGGKKRSFDIMTTPSGDTYYVRVRVYDTSGNYSGYTPSVEVQTYKADAEVDIAQPLPYSKNYIRHGLCDSDRDWNITSKPANYTVNFGVESGGYARTACEVAANINNHAIDDYFEMYQDVDVTQIQGPSGGGMWFPTPDNPDGALYHTSIALSGLISYAESTGEKIPGGLGYGGALTLILELEYLDASKAVLYSGYASVVGASKTDAAPVEITYPKIAEVTGPPPANYPTTKYVRTKVRVNMSLVGSLKFTLLQMESGRKRTYWRENPTTSLVLVPVKGCIPYFGDTNNIPAGWVLCDGTNGTPDLRGKFILGADATHPAGGTGGSASHDHGVSTSVTVTETTDAAEASSGYPTTVVTGVDATASTDVSPADHMPPYIAMNWIMRLW